jgi:diaminopimelate epimerase
LLEIGPKAEVSPLFPQRVNAGFARMAGNQIELRVWERGCGETMACGSGACAALVSAVLTGRVQAGQMTTIRVRGGQLYVVWQGEGKACVLTGPARVVFEGKIGV